MKLTRAEADWLGLDDEQRPWVADDSKEAAEIRELRGKRNPAVSVARPAFSLAPGRTASGSSALTKAAWAHDDRLVEDTRQPL